MQKTKLTFIVIGAAGFIGSAFSAFLKLNNYQVFDVFRGQISGIESDFHFIAELLKIEHQQIVVVDFAYTSVPNSSFNDPVSDYTQNLYNVIRHLELVKQLPKASYIYISSGGTVYGNSGNELPISENHTNIPLSPYGITKLACEKYVLMYKEVYGIDVKIVRPSNIYGPGQKPYRGQGLIATATAKVLKKETIQIFGDGLQVRDYLFIDDLNKVLLDIVEFGENGSIYNIGSGAGLTINNIITTITTLIGISPSVEYLPFRPFDVRYNVLNSDAVSSLNNWKPTVSLDEGLRTTVEWLKALF